MTDAAPLVTAPVLELRDIHQTYGAGETAVQALRGIDLRVERGDYLAIMGPSGSGKSTLMNLLGCLDIATSGQYLLGGVDVSELDDRQLAKVRNRQIGGAGGYDEHGAERQAHGKRAETRRPHRASHTLRKGMYGSPRPLTSTFRT